MMAGARDSYQKRIVSSFGSARNRLKTYLMQLRKNGEKDREMYGTQAQREKFVNDCVTVEGVKREFVSSVIQNVDILKFSEKELLGMWL